MRVNSIAKAALFPSLLACILLGGAQAHGLPQYLMRFSQDPFSRPELRNQCATCHINPQGSGPRNPFGNAFDRNDHVVTPEFRAAWPTHFLPSVATEAVAMDGQTVKATLLASEQDTILEIGGQYFRLSNQEAKLEKIDSQEAARLLATPPPPAGAAEEPRLPLRNQPTFDHYLVNLPTTLPYQRGGLSLRFTHRFVQPVLRTGEDCPDCADVTNLFGFDSFSYSSLGGEFGITRWLAGTIYRTPLDRTYELGGVVQLLRQEGVEPFAAAARVSLETRRLFDPGKRDYARFQTVNLVFPVSRAISDVAAVFVAPMVSFRANPFPVAPSPRTAEGETREHQGAVGLGASLRFRPRSAFVVEWTPRVAGFHEMDSRNAYSFGIQRTTNAHVFELVLTNTLGTTTSRAVSGGGSDFRLGFNLYRRLR